MLMCIQNLVKFCPFVLKILSGNENYDGITELRNYRITEGQTGQIQYSPHFSKPETKIMTELQNYGITELQKDRQGKSSIAPTFQSGAIIIPILDDPRSYVTKAIMKE